jgi:DNA-binding transcriptional LysR family regulator
MNITFKQLKVFIALYELGSFTATARALRMTQSAVSKLCHELESEVNFPLFERTTRSVTPMDGADTLYSFARELTGTLDATTLSLSDLSSLKRGSVSVSAAPMIMHGLLSEVFARFKHEHPDIRLVLHESSTDETIEYVISGKVDFGVIAIDKPHPKLSCEPIYRDRLCLVCPPGHPLADKRAVTWKQIAEYEQIALRPVNSLGRELQRIVESKELPFKSTIEAGAVSSILGLVKAGLGVAVIPGYVTQLAQLLGLGVVPIRGGDETLRELTLIRRWNARSSLAAESFIGMMRQHLKTVPGAVLHPGRNRAG